QTLEQPCDADLHARWAGPVRWWAGTSRLSCDEPVQVRVERPTGGLPDGHESLTPRIVMREGVRSCRTAPYAGLCRSRSSSMRGRARIEANRLRLASPIVGSAGLVGRNGGAISWSSRASVSRGRTVRHDHRTPG